MQELWSKQTPLPGCLGTFSFYVLNAGIKLGSETVTANGVISAGQEFIPSTNSAMCEVPQIPEKVCMKVLFFYKHTITLNSAFSYRFTKQNP